MSEAYRYGEQSSPGTPEAALSALLDGELSEFETRRLLDLVAERPELMETWSRYSLARSVLEGEPCQRASEGFSGRVAQLVASEPRPAGNLPGGRLPRRWIQPLGRMAVAASVAVAVFLGMELSMENENSGAPMMAGNSTLQPEAMRIDADAQRRLNEYIQSVAISGERSDVSDALAELETLRQTPQLRPVSDRELVPLRETRD